MNCGSTWDFATLSGKYTLGIIFIVVCAVIWAGASVLIQYIYEDLDFKSPFFLTYMATSLLAFHLPAHFAHHYIQQHFNPAAEGDIGYTSVSSTADNESDNDHPRSEIESVDVNGSLRRWCSWIPAEHYDVIKIAMIICPLWFGANCFYNYSLLMTSVSSSTIISNLSASFTLAFSWWMGIEDASVVKIVGIVICFAGAVSVGLQDDTSSDDDTGSVGGDIMAVIGSIGYGLYTTAMRYKVPDDSQVSMQLLLGYIGLINAVILTPALIIMFLMRWGNVQDISGEVVGFISLNGFADTVLADYFWARAVVLTSPTVATIGMSITIPIAILTDYIIKGVQATWVSVLGAMCVVAGFVLVNLAPEAVDRHLSQCKHIIVGYLCGDTSDSERGERVMSEEGRRKEEDKSRIYEQISPITSHTTTTNT